MKHEKMENKQEYHTLSQNLRDNQFLLHPFTPIGRYGMFYIKVRTEPFLTHRAESLIFTNVHTLHLSSQCNKLNCSGHLYK